MGALRAQCALQRRLAGRQLRQQFRADGQQVATGQRRDLADVAKARAHDFGGDAEFFVMVVDLTHRLHAGVLGAGLVGFHPGRARRFFIPVVNAPYKRRYELHLGLAASDRLTKRKQQGEVGVNPAALQFFGSDDTLPGGRHLDQHTLSGNAFSLVQRNQTLAPGQCCGAVKAQARVHLGRHPAGYQRQNFAAKTHQQAVHHFIQRLAAKSRHLLLHQRLVVGFLHRLEDQRRVGGGVLRLELRQLFEVAGVGHHRGQLFERVELIHGLIMRVSFDGVTHGMRKVMIDLKF